MKTLLLATVFAFMFSTPSMGQASVLREGGVSIEVGIPEVQELLFVLFALSERGRNDAAMLDRHTAYFEEVMDWFSKYEGEKLVKRINRRLLRDYNELRMEACHYRFDKDGQLVKASGVRDFSWKEKGFIEAISNELAEFAAISSFRQFYAEHQAYYDVLRKQMEAQALLQEQALWLNSKFGFSYDNFQVYFSPLGRGRHSTNSEVAMKHGEVGVFVSGPYPEDASLPVGLLERAHICRMVFTEVDHNYVNPTSNNYIIQIEAGFSQRGYWVSRGKAKGYSSAYEVFNEYMTWGLYLLFAKAYFPASIFEQLQRQLIEQMESGRGFIRFRDFQDRLFALYDPEQPIQALFTPMLEWAAVTSHQSLPN